MPKPSAITASGSPTVSDGTRSPCGHPARRRRDAARDPVHHGSQCAVVARDPGAGGRLVTPSRAATLAVAALLAVLTGCAPERRAASLPADRNAPILYVAL